VLCSYGSTDQCALLGSPGGKWRRDRFTLIDPSDRVCVKLQIDERLVLPEWAVIPLHAGTLTKPIALMAASAEDGGERTLKPADRSRVPCCPIHRDVN
jgi:hypothetical protein